MCCLYSSGLLRSDQLDDDADLKNLCRRYLFDVDRLVHSLAVWCRQVSSGGGNLCCCLLWSVVFVLHEAWTLTWTVSARCTVVIHIGLGTQKQLQLCTMSMYHQSSAKNQTWPGPDQDPIMPSRLWSLASIFSDLMFEFWAMDHWLTEWLTDWLTIPNLFFWTLCLVQPRLD